MALYCFRWDFYSESHDIKFGVLSKDEEGKENVVIPVRRVPCHQSEEVGFILCSAPATCKLNVFKVYEYHEFSIYTSSCS